MAVGCTWLLGINVRCSPSMEYSTSRIHLSKLSADTSRIQLPKHSAAPSLRISLSSQYKNRGPIVTPIRKPRSSSSKKRARQKTQHAHPAQKTTTQSRQPLSLAAPSPHPDAFRHRQDLPVADELATNMVYDYDNSAYIDGPQQEGSLDQHDAASHQPEHEVARDFDSDRHPQVTPTPIAEYHEVQREHLPIPKIDRYQLFFESVISGSLPFYQLSKKTFVANGWNDQRSEASVSDMDSFVWMSANILLGSLVSYTCQYGGKHEDSRMSVSGFQEDFFLLSFQVHT